MPYDRWGQTTVTAEALTGAVTTDVALAAAEEEVVDELGWRPDPDGFGDADPAAANHDVRVVALGRAIAWQAAHRAATAATASDGDTAVESESIDNYSVTYRDGKGPASARLTSARTATLLARGGWYAPVRSARTHTSPS